jgi:hypothetical protein
VSRAGIEKFLFRFDKEPARQSAFAAAQEEAFDGVELDAEEKNALTGKDLATLYRWGIHPLLIRNFAGTLGLKYVDLYRAGGIEP